MAKVDAKIRRNKEIYRSVLAGLPCDLPKSRVADLVMYCVTRLNLRRTSALHSHLCPAFLFTGVKPIFQKVFGLSFGDYAEVYDGTMNTSSARSVPCIALYPTGNASGSWVFWSLKTSKHLRNYNWKKMVTTPLVIGAVDAIANLEVDVEAQPADDQDKVDVPEAEVAENEIGCDDDVIVEEEKAPVAITVEPRRSERIIAGFNVPVRFIHVTKVKKSEWGEGMRATQCKDS